MQHIANKQAKQQERNGSVDLLHVRLFVFQTKRAENQSSIPTLFAGQKKKENLISKGKSLRLTSLVAATPVLVYYPVICMANSHYTKLYFSIVSE